MPNAKPLTIAIIFGGQSVEHLISIQSARAVIKAIDPRKFSILPIAITREGFWLQPEETKALLNNMDSDSSQEIHLNAELKISKSFEVLEMLTDVDVVFPLIHGSGGEDGKLQGFLEIAGLPYVGSGVSASVIGLDKTLTKVSFERAGLPVTPYKIITDAQWISDRHGIESALTPLGIPAFVKPATGGSSIGITKVLKEDEMTSAIDNAFKFDRKVIVESGINGRECECAVLGNRLNGMSVGKTEIQVSPVGEIRTKREFYDYIAKYEDTKTQLIVPADLLSHHSDELQRLAREAFIAVGCTGMARVDFFLTDDGTIWLNEINTIPGFTKLSMFPRAWEAAGLRFPDLITKLIDLAMLQHQGKGNDG